MHPLSSLSVWSSSCVLAIRTASLLFLTPEPYVFYMLRLKHFTLLSFPVLFLLFDIPCLVKLDTCSQPLHLKPLWRPLWLKPTTACKFYICLCRSADKTCSRCYKTSSRSDRTCNGGDRTCSQGDKTCNRGDETCSQGDRTCSRGDRTCSQGDRTCSQGNKTCSRDDATCRRGWQNVQSGWQNVQSGWQNVPQQTLWLLPGALLQTVKLLWKQLQLPGKFRVTKCACGLCLAFRCEHSLPSHLMECICQRAVAIIHRVTPRAFSWATLRRHQLQQQQRQMWLRSLNKLLVSESMWELLLSAQHLGCMNVLVYARAYDPVCCVRYL